MGLKSSRQQGWFPLEPPGKNWSCQHSLVCSHITTVFVFVVMSCSLCRKPPSVSLLKTLAMAFRAYLDNPDSNKIQKDDNLSILRSGT